MVDERAQQPRTRAEVEVDGLPGDPSEPPDLKGMVRPFVSTAVGGATGAAAPGATITVSLRDAATIGIDGEIRSGKQTWLVVNDGPSPHAAILARPAAGRTVDELVAWLRAPSASARAGAVVGGVSPLSGGRRAWAVLDLSPGTYVLFDDAPFGANAQWTTFVVP